MAYNLTFTNTTNNVGDIAVAMASNVGPLFGGIILFIVFLTFYGLSSRYGASSGFLASSFITSIVGILMMFGGLTTWPVVIIPIIFFIGGIAYRFFADKVG